MNYRFCAYGDTLTVTSNDILGYRNNEEFVDEYLADEGIAMVIANKAMLHNRPIFKDGCWHEVNTVENTWEWREGLSWD